MVAGQTLYASGQVVFDGEQLVSKGKVPSQVSLEAATQAAALCPSNVLRAIRKRLGSLERIELVLRITGYVNADPDFTDEHWSLMEPRNWCATYSERQVGTPRQPWAWHNYPLGSSVEVEMILKIKPD